MDCREVREVPKVAKSNSDSESESNESKKKLYLFCIRSSSYILLFWVGVEIPTLVRVGIPALSSIVLRYTLGLLGMLLCAVHCTGTPVCCNRGLLYGLTCSLLLPGACSSSLSHTARNPIARYQLWRQLCPGSLSGCYAPTTARVVFDFWH